MPPTRRTTGGARARNGPAKGQSTISFSNRVTKPGATLDAKKPAVSSSIKPKPEDVASRTPEEQVPSKVDIEVGPEEERVHVEKEATQAGTAEPRAAPEKSEAEVRAEKITDAQIGKYWKGIEALRIAPRVHVGDLSVGEKVLRYFDVSSQYGPCVGIRRKNRWARAEKLGLEPPIEVLAVLLKEDKKGAADETAHMDEILNSIAVG